MKKRPVYLGLLCGLATLGAVAVFHYLPQQEMPIIREYAAVDRAPGIRPDYADTIVPPNIAPLNFVVVEPAARCYVKVYSASGQPIEIVTKTGKVMIPIGPWRKLLDANRGQKLYFDVYTQDEGGRWQKFQPVANSIARQDMDGYLAYRLIGPVYSIWADMGVYQRDLQDFEESVILHNGYFSGGCLNCHTFYKNDPANMLMDIRSSKVRPGPGGTVVVRDGEVRNVVNTTTDFNPIWAIYLSWHPSGKLIAFSSNRIVQFFHGIGETRDVFDHESNLALYLFDSNTVTTSPEISKPDRMETYPHWSPDGEYLYFCSAPQLPIERYKDVLYDLMRISYDAESNTWGQAETVLLSSQTGLSITHPRISPDGKFLLFCMSSYGNFSIYQPSSDLYMMEMATGKYRRLDVNSDKCESWHCWSSNGRWVVFSSKRLNGLLARPYFSYVDQDGNLSKPLLLPQKDPTFYDSCIKTYNVPEFIKDRVSLTPRALAKGLYASDKQLKAKLDPEVKVPGPSSAPAKEVQYEPGPGG